MNDLNGLFSQDSMQKNVRITYMMNEMASTVAFYLMGKLCNKEEVAQIFKVCKERHLAAGFPEYEVNSVVEEIMGIVFLIIEARDDSSFYGEEVVEDGYGSAWSAICPKCEKKSMVVVSVGKVKCTGCDIA